MIDMKKRVTWTGKTQCDACGFDTKHEEGDGVLYDAQDQLTDTWGVFCSQCFRELGCRVGTGLGQKYRWDGEEWIKVAG